MQRNDYKRKFNYRGPYVPILKADVSITKNLFIISIRQIISINDADKTIRPQNLFENTIVLDTA